MLTHVRCVNRTIRFIIHPPPWPLLACTPLLFSVFPRFAVLSPDVFLSFSRCRASGLVHRMLAGYRSGSQPSALIGSCPVIRPFFSRFSKCLGNTWLYIQDHGTIGPRDRFFSRQADRLELRSILKIYLEDPASPWSKHVIDQDERGERGASRRYSIPPTTRVAAN